MQGDHVMGINYGLKEQASRNLSLPTVNWSTCKSSTFNIQSLIYWQISTSLYPEYPFSRDKE
jgi:hypothetical protein